MALCIIICNNNMYMYKLHNPFAQQCFNINFMCRVQITVTNSILKKRRLTYTHTHTHTYTHTHTHKHTHINVFKKLNINII